MRPVIIIGAGIAGMTAAVTLSRRGQKCILVSPLPSERAQSVMAEGGINAALNTKGEHDTVWEHFEDTLRAGCDLADPNAVRRLTDGAPDLVRWLSSLGVAFNRTKEGEIDLRYFGGQKKRRTAFAQSSTGKQIAAALIQETRRWEGKGLVQRLPHHWVEKITVNAEGQCTGCIVKDSYSEDCRFLQGNVILASGGMNGLFGKTTGTIQNTGGATAAAFAAGAACANLEMIQYHPTTTPISGKRALISEAARGEGGRLFVWRGDERWYYMEEKYPELKNLMPRDVVSRETVLACEETGDRNAWLDLTGISEEVFKTKLSELLDFCLEFVNVDPRRTYVPVYPGIHYFMGGLYVDPAHRTTLPGLYAAGECACQYHGANRLGGNSLLGAAFGGKTAAETVLEEWSEWEDDPEHVLEEYNGECSAIADHRQKMSLRAIEREMVECMKACMGIRRDEERLEEGLTHLYALESILERSRDDSASLMEHKTLLERIRLAQAMVESARERRESRGAQWRSDYSARDDEHFRKTTVARRRNGKNEITFVEIAKEGEPWHIA